MTLILTWIESLHQTRGGTVHLDEAGLWRRLHRAMLDRLGEQAAIELPIR
jgi:hypothetical protein